MPIARVGCQLIYFAHVPKCAGSSVENYLKKRFGPVAFINTGFSRTPLNRRWARSSPQHIDREALSKLFPEDFFDHTFAIVRDPVSRIISTWYFQLEVERLIPDGTGFGEWLVDLEERLETDPYCFDNHVRPMSDLVPQGAMVFKLEDGLDPVVEWLDQIAGNSEGPRNIDHTNERSKRKRKTVKIVPSPSDIEAIKRIYARDFARFGYEEPRSQLGNDEHSGEVAIKKRQPVLRALSRFRGRP